MFLKQIEVSMLFRLQKYLSNNKISNLFLTPQMFLEKCLFCEMFLSTAAEKILCVALFEDK